MRMKIMWSALIAIAFASCTQEDVLKNGIGLNLLSASLEQGETQSRVGFTDGDASFFWTKGDKIGVTTTSNPTFHEMTLEGDGGQATGTFLGTFDGTISGYAVYPFGEQDSHSIIENKLIYNLPATYNYSTLDTEYAMANGNSHNAPMWGSISNGSVSFKHLGGVIAFRVDNLPENTQNMQFVLTATNQISGSFNAILTEEEPIIETVADNVTDADKNVTITFSTATGQTSGYFYVPVPTGLIGDLTVIINNGTEEAANVMWNNITIKRKDIRRATIYCNGEIKSVNSISEVNDALFTEEDNLIVQVSGEVTGTENTIEIPSELTTETTTFSFASVADNAKITIQNEDRGSYTGQIIIEVPEGEIIPEVVANIPDGEVYIKQGTVTTLVSHSADNTTIIGKDAIVGTLIVAKGNVRIEEGGQVAKIERATDNSSTIYVVYEGANAPEIEKDDDVVLMSVGEYEFKKAIDEEATLYQIPDVATLKFFRDAVNGGKSFAGCTIELMNDLDLDNENWTPIGFNSNDEAGNEAYFSGTFDGKNHTISNLKIDVTDKGGVGLFGAVNNATFKNFTLNNVDIKAVESESDPTNSSGAEGKKNYIVGGHMGAVAGYDAAAGTLNFENVHVTGLIKIEGETRAAQGQRVGGIIGGRSSSTVNFNNVSVKGSEGSYIKGYCSTAGVMGQNQAVGTFTNVQTDIDIHAITFGAGGIVGIVRQGSTFTNCSSAGDITLDASMTQLSSYSANYPYRVGGIAGCWSESSTGVLTLTNCSYTGVLTSIDEDGNKVTALDYAGYVGRGYTLKNCAGSKVTINGISYVQADDTVYGVYTIDGVYEMNTLADMQWLANKVNTGADYFTGKTVKLVNDIDLNNVEWTPIGSASLEHGFCGNFDGNNKTIKNLKIANVTLDADGNACAGLFGVTERISKDEQNYIKDLTIENVNISTEGHKVAAAIAYPYYTTVENITVKGDINIQGEDYTAGVLAYTSRCVDAKNLVITANSGSSITGNITVGGVISDIQMHVGLTANYSNFKASGLIITGEKCVGGISGNISSQTLDGATVENVTIECDDARKGTVSGALGDKSTIKNISVTNVTGATNVVGATYDEAKEVVVDGDNYYKAETNN